MNIYLIILLGGIDAVIVSENPPTTTESVSKPSPSVHVLEYVPSDDGAIPTQSSIPSKQEKSETNINGLNDPIWFVLVTLLVLFITGIIIGLFLRKYHKKTNRTDVEQKVLSSPIASKPEYEVETPKDVFANAKTKIIDSVENDIPWGRTYEKENRESVAFSVRDSLTSLAQLSYSYSFSQNK
jgi:hypothetical protein